MIFFTFTYLIASEYVSAKKSKGEILLFQRGHRSSRAFHSDVEKPSQLPERGENAIQEFPRKMEGTLQKQTSIFQWRDVCFDIKIQKETRRILNHVDGWVKPGTLTALMVSHVLKIIFILVVESIKPSYAMF
jgi:ATP-binding cassette subfamily G (WHITE) protein 2 (PDR)